MANYLYIIIPVGVILLTLKCCLLFWRIHYYQQRRRNQLVQQQQLQRNAMIRAHQARTYARLSAANRGGLARITARGADGTQQVFIVPTSVLNCQDGRGGAAGITLTAEELLIGMGGRVNRTDPNVPPSYDQAVSGEDKSVKVEEASSPAPPPEHPPPEYSPPNSFSDSTPLLTQ